MPTLRAAALRPLIGLVGAAAALTSCGGSDGTAPAAGLDRFQSQQALQGVTCRDWNGADPASRRELVRRLRTITGGPVTGEGVIARGTVLDDDDAHRLFDTRCKPHYARGFVLYKLYGQAAGFVGRAP